MGQNFAKAFDITSLDEQQNRVYPYQTSWGFSTRTIGALILVHGDDRGLKLPPKLAPMEAVIVPIWRGENKGDVRKEAEKLYAGLQAEGFRMEVDPDEEHSPGWKFNEHELRGVPVRVEIGPKDFEKEQVVFVRRDTRKKEFVPHAGVAERLRELLAEIQNNMLARRWSFGMRIPVTRLPTKSSRRLSPRSVALSWPLGMAPKRPSRRSRTIPKPPSGCCLQNGWKDRI